MIAAKHILWWLSSGAAALALVRLLALRLASKYPMFSTYIALECLHNGVLLAIGDSHSESYALAWMLLEPAVLALQAATVWELYGKVCEHYPGIGGFSRVLLSTCLWIAAVLCFLTIQPEISGKPWRPQVFHFIFIGEPMRRVAFVAFCGVVVINCLVVELKSF